MAPMNVGRWGGMPWDSTPEAPMVRRLSPWLVGSLCSAMLVAPANAVTVTWVNVGASTIIEGFTITGAFQGYSVTAPSGGINLAGDAIVRNNIITGNHAWFGGGISVLRGAPTISGNTISHNSAWY